MGGTESRNIEETYRQIQDLDSEEKVQSKLIRDKILDQIRLQNNPAYKEFFMDSVKKYRRNVYRVTKEVLFQTRAVYLSSRGGNLSGQKRNRQIIRRPDICVEFFPDEQTGMVNQLMYITNPVIMGLPEWTTLHYSLYFGIPYEYPKDMGKNIAKKLWNRSGYTLRDYNCFWSIRTIIDNDNRNDPNGKHELVFTSMPFTDKMDDDNPGVGVGSSIKLDRDTGLVVISNIINILLMALTHNAYIISDFNNFMNVDQGRVDDIDKIEQKYQRVYSTQGRSFRDIFEEGVDKKEEKRLNIRKRPEFSLDFSAPERILSIIDDYGIEPINLNREQKSSISSNRDSFIKELYRRAAINAQEDVVSFDTAYINTIGVELKRLGTKYMHNMRLGKNREAEDARLKISKIRYTLEHPDLTYGRYGDYVDPGQFRQGGIRYQYTNPNISGQRRRLPQPLPQSSGIINDIDDFIKTINEIGKIHKINIDNCKSSSSLSGGIAYPINKDFIGDLVNKATKLSKQSSTNFQDELFTVMEYEINKINKELYNSSTNIKQKLCNKLLLIRHKLKNMKNQISVPYQPPQMPYGPGIQPSQMSSSGLGYQGSYSSGYPGSSSSGFGYPGPYYPYPESIDELMSNLNDYNVNEILDMIRSSEIKNDIKLSGDTDNDGQNIQNNFNKSYYPFLNKMIQSAKILSDDTNRLFSDVFIDLLGAGVKKDILEIDTLVIKDRKGKLDEGSNEQNQLKEAKKRVMVYNYVITHPESTYRSEQPDVLVENIKENTRYTARKAVDKTADAISYVWSFVPGFHMRGYEQQ